MNAFVPTHPADWHPRFLAMVRKIRSFARWAFRHLPSVHREELVQEALANAWKVYRRLVELNKESLAYPTVLASYAVRQIRSGRRVSGAKCRDPLSEHARGRCPVQPLDSWKELVSETRRATPAEIAALRLDFAGWLSSLDPLKRQVALLLSTGEKTGVAARRFGMVIASVQATIPIELWT